MCYGRHRSVSPERRLSSSHRQQDENALALENLRVRLAQTEARLERARAREAELSQLLEEMKRFVSVMEILESYVKRRFREKQEQLSRLFCTFQAK